MFGSELINTALNVTEITSLLSVYNTNKVALFSDLLIPANCKGKETINFYMSSNFDGSSEVKEYEYIINCRSGNYRKSRQIALAVFNALNRVHGVDSFKICTVLQTIIPIDDTDTYNTPVLTKIKVR